MPWTAIGNFCKDFVLKLAGEKYHNLALIAFSWKEIVGELLAERSAPAKYEHHVLFVKVSNPTWMQELVLIKPQIITRANSLLDLQINEIVYLTGSKHARKLH
jgi:hypothetical protein